VVQVKITQKGRDALAALDEPLLSLNKRLLSHMTAAELADLTRLLEKARRSPDLTPDGPVTCGETNPHCEG
jgi:DNA-binding MarR family transcriptional regulator